MVTRFHVFVDCVHCLLRWILLALPPDEVLRPSCTSRMKWARKRLATVRAYLKDPQTGLDLRRAALCLQLTMYATNITGQRVVRLQRGAACQAWPRGSADEREPTIVKLARGHVATWSWARLADIMAHLADGPALRAHEGSVLEALAVTAGELQVRFRQYELWPARVVLMSRLFNPNGFVDEAQALLTAAPESLDLGYSLPLRTRAVSAGGAVRGPSVPSVCARAGRD